MKRETLRKVARVMETGGLSLIFEREEISPDPESTPPATRLERFTEVLSTGGYSLLDRHIEVEPATAQLPISEKQTPKIEE